MTNLRKGMEAATFLHNLISQEVIEINMTVNTEPDKLTPPAGTGLPRMIGDSDVALIRTFGSLLRPDATIVEFGPWLGGVTEVLTEYGQVEVIDRFEWSEQNAAAHPEAELNPGDSFRPLFEQNMAARGRNVTVYESPYQDFVWPKDRFDLCFIDAPRNVSGLLHCLRAIAHAWPPEVPVLLKHGLGVTYPELPATLEVLVSRGILALPASTQPAWCNIAALYPGPNFQDLETLKASDLPGNVPLSKTLTDPWGGRLLATARLAERFMADDFVGALQILDTAPQEPSILYAWDTFESVLSKETDADTGALAAFAEVLAAQIDPCDAPVANCASLPTAFRAFWHNNTGQHRWSHFNPPLIAAAMDRGAMVWPSRLAERIHGQRVIEIGQNLTYSPVGYFNMGAARYLGITLGDLNSDMIKVEGQLPEATFLPLSGANSERANEVDLCLIHEAVADHPDVGELIEKITPSLAKGAQLLVLPMNSDTPRRYAK